MDTTVTTFSRLPWLFSFVVLANACASSAPFRRHDVEGALLVIRVSLQTEIEEPVLARATSQATSVLRHAGAEPEWVISSTHLGSNPTAPPIEPSDLIVRIVADGANTRPSTCGMALGRLVTIFANCVNLTSALFEIDPAWVDPATVYAYTIVHEIGHVLLPRGHAVIGIMRAQPDWTRAGQNTLDFTPDEIVRIRHTLAVRSDLISQAATRRDGAPAK